MKRCGIIVWILCLAVSFLAGGSQRVAASLDDNAGSGGSKNEITVGYVAFDHMIKEDREGNFYGYGVSYLKELAKYTGWTYRYVKIEETERVSKLLSGEIDLFCSMHKDCEQSGNLQFSKNSSGLEYAMLCAGKDNDEIFFNDYDAINGRKIGINKSTEMENSLILYAMENGISYEPVYFDDFEEMKQALEQGTVDMMLASSLRNIGDIKYVGKAHTIDEYFATGPQNAELMETLNAADDALKQERPFFVSALYDEFYGPPYQRLTGITREEYEFIRRGTPIRVVCDANSYPVEYRDEETGEYGGIYADALELISEESGLKFEFIPVKEYSNAWDMICNNRADLIAGNYGNGKMAMAYDMVFSQSYLSAEYTLVGNKGKELPDKPSIALPKNYIGIQNYYRENDPEWEIVRFDNVEACLRAVNSGKADVTAINSTFLQTVFNLNNYENLKIIPNMTSSIPISIGIGGKDSAVIKSILDKAIYQIPETKFKKCITENAINISYLPNMMETLKSVFPYIMIGLLVCVLSVSFFIARREKHFRHLAMTDSVTGLWNGVKFCQEAKELLERNRESTYFLITLDINKFKFINNDFGTQAGDRILWMIGQRIRETFRGNGKFARNTADIFLVLIEEKEFKEEMLRVLSRDVFFDNNGKKQYYRINVKAGIRVIRPEEELEDITLYIDQSSMARKTVKDSANEDIAYYDEDMREAIARELSIENKMEEALVRREFQVYLQPKFSLRTGKITGAEALVRWVEPDGRIIPPDMFIPLFEKNGFILKVDFYVYEEVMKRMALWQEMGRVPICVSVNVSRVHIGTPDFFAKLNYLVEKYHISKDVFELELTETIMGGEHSITRDFIMECKKQGYQVSIDDFGSGYSSLNLLKDLPVDILKIDKAFLDDTESSKRNSIIVEKVVEMAQKMEIGTLCEGVETLKQVIFLKKIGCDMAQGYLFSRPVPMDEFEKML